MKKKSISKLKLTKSTIADLDRVRGGKVLVCACNFLLQNMARNRDCGLSKDQSACMSCYGDDYPSCG
ncbi:MAG: hypothetical protein GY950_14520 [bacterium]|nr:hypothetical protein [bacterium]